MDTLSIHAFHPRCPFCDSDHGSAREVTMKGPARTVTYECVTCRERWSATDDAPAAFMSLTKAH
jgi:hypothetical protein